MRQVIAAIALSLVALPAMADGLSYELPPECYDFHGCLMEKYEVVPPVIELGKMRFTCKGPNHFICGTKEGVYHAGQKKRTFKSVAYSPIKLAATACKSIGKGALWLGKASEPAQPFFNLVGALGSVGATAAPFIYAFLAK